MQGNEAEHLKLKDMNRLEFFKATSYNNSEDTLLNSSDEELLKFIA